MSIINFDQISFDQVTKELSIKNNGSVVAGPFKLDDQAVKLRINRTGTQLSVEAETGTIGCFPTEDLVNKMQFAGTDHNANLLFGTLSEVSTIKLSGHLTQNVGIANEYALGIIGVEDIRNNKTAPATLLMLEGEIASFEIDTDDLLVVRYHNSITPNV